MTKKSKAQRETSSTQRAARAFSRRTMLKGATAVGTIAAMGPWIVKDAFSSSGEVTFLNWSDELPDPVIPNFEAKTGIKV